MSGSLIYRPGALSKKQIKEFQEKYNILENVKEENIDESSFDLTLSDECYEFDHAVKPMKDESYSVVVDNKTTKKTVNGTFLLNKKKIYVFRLRELVNFKNHNELWGLATGKSSLGRLDLLVRLMADHSSCYDFVPKTQAGSSLYVEIIPITFDVIVNEGFAISQLRLFVGHPEYNKISDRRLENVYKFDLLKKENGEPLSKDDNFSDFKRLTVNLKPDRNLNGKPCAFKAKKDTEPIPLAELEKEFKKTKNERELLNPKKYWEAVTPERETLILEKESFYIMRSRERLFLPDHVCVGCEAVKEELGELRIHYAGFAHPGFGRNRGENDDKGTPLIFEVRGHNFDTRLRNGEALAELEFYNMSDVDNYEMSDYDRQELKLSKYFEDWT